MSVAFIRANGRFSSKALGGHCIFCKRSSSCWDCAQAHGGGLWGLYCSPDLGSHTTLVMTSVPGWAADTCWDLPFPASRWMTRSSARGPPRSAPGPALCLRAVQSHYRHYVHCSQPPPLIDLGPGPFSNCFLQIGFALDCWLSIE